MDNPNHLSFSFAITYLRPFCLIGNVKSYLADLTTVVHQLQIKLPTLFFFVKELEKDRRLSEMFIRYHCGRDCC